MANGMFTNIYLLVGSDTRQTLGGPAGHWLPASELIHSHQRSQGLYPADADVQSPDVSSAAPGRGRKVMEKQEL